MHLVKQSTTASIATQRARQRPEGLAGWLLTTWSVWRQESRPHRKQMRVVETLALGAKRQLVLVECAGERFLVGTGSDQVTTIVRARTERRESFGPLTSGPVAMEDRC